MRSFRSALLFALLGTGPLCSAAGAQTLEIETLPPYGSLGSLTGSVTGVDPLAHHVATYIHIEGAGWWSKPTALDPTVVIDAEGDFTANVGTGGPDSLDGSAVIFCAALLPLSTEPDAAEGDARIPASLAPLAMDCEERFGRVISFAGFDWAVKEADQPAGPGLNRFSDRVEDVFVDAQGLHLRIAFHDGHWWSSEVILLAPVGHGSYVVQTDSELDDLDPQAILGIFTWDSYGDDETVPGAGHREIDFEDSRWSNASDPTNAQMVVQPYTNPQNLRRYTIPDLSADAALTRIFRWLPDRIEFTALRGHHGAAGFPPGDVIDAWTYLHDPPNRHVPPEGRERLRLNLWLNNRVVTGQGPPAPASGQPVEVVIRDVQFLPEPAPLAGLPLVGALVLLGRGRRGCEAQPRRGRRPQACGLPAGRG